MYYGSRKVLVPSFLFVFASLLLGFLAASTPGVTLETEPATRAERETTLPWEPLTAPGSGPSLVASALDARRSRERIENLEAIYRDRSRSEHARGLAAFALGVQQLNAKRVDAAVSHFRAPEIASTELMGYALYYISRELESKDPDRALEALELLDARYSDFALKDEALLRHARLWAAKGNREEALRRLTTASTSADREIRGEALDEMAKHLEALGRYEEAIATLETLYYENPRYERVRQAGRRLTRLRSKVPEVDDAHLYQLAFDRAEHLMDERRYRDAYTGFRSLLTRFPKLVDQELVRLRMAVSQYRRRRLTASVADFKRVTRRDLAPEALFYRAEVGRRLRRTKTFFTRVDELVTRFPKSSWTEKALLSLADYHDYEDENDEAVRRYEQLVRMFPRGEHVHEAKWHLHWDQYVAGRYAEAATGFEEAARERPGARGLSRLLYWAGRSYQRAERLERAESLYRQVLLGYKNTYYGRRSLERLSEIRGERASLETVETARDGIDLSGALAVDRVDVQQRIAELVATGLSERALAEAKAAVSGKRDDAAFMALAAYIHATERRNNLQAIITIRDAFPFHSSATGDLLPRPIWELFYPLPYREHVERYAEARGLDPYLVAALIRQESTFNPRVRSAAGARGLMQIIPATGKQLARQERRPYRTQDLYNPEINIRYGTRYLRDVLKRFEGRVDYALAGYNAGPHRVRRWTGMDMTLDEEIFIEEIPFQETRNYVKLVLRNEMLYRRLYGRAESVASAP